MLIIPNLVKFVVSNWWKWKINIYPQMVQTAKRSSFDIELEV